MSFLLACGLHAVLLFGTAGLFVQPPRYDVQSGSGGMEISLVAAPARPAGNPSALSVPEAGPESEEDGLTEEKAEAAGAGAVGDGSSPVPGQDPTTFYLPGGAASGTGGRFKNPAPAYPYQAIRENQQGVVVLEICVDKNGRPTSVEVAQSSGFPLLDQSALWTVRRWKFDPAHVGFIPT
ncbi:MAG: energy transducer TonB, partial [Candidatus Omnitrophota bacterium]|nr:energy transducer TonB [Candidatus Omnitrophota bacterium]